MLIDLFVTFFMIGLVSFGGGYAMIPLIQEEVVNRHEWMNNQHFTDLIGVAGISPGPIASNIAILIGYQEAGIVGAIIASLGILLPSLIIVIAVGMFFFRVRQNKLMQSSFYGLRSIITGLIFYAAVMFALNSGLMSSLSWFTWSQILIFIASLCALLFFRKHPVSIIILSGLVGIALYG
ncbi:chromate transporter [Cohnella sp.]|uniref:chromate transporter n=1 Tax=Cohnella sp. TaxID=1883426 RepID=UPI0035658FFF